MWKEQMIKDIEKIKFNPNKLFKNINTNEFITRNEYIDLALDNFLIREKKKIESLYGLYKLEFLESNLEDLEEITHNKYNYFECNNELAKSIVTFIYWKYRNPRNKLDVKFNMADIKNVVGLDNIFIEKIISPIYLNTHCHMCSGNATISVPSHEHNRVIFKCNTCGHFYETASVSNSKINEYKSVPYVKCECNHCKNIKSKIYQRGIDWFNNLKIICASLFIGNNIPTINFPSENMMRRDFHNYFTQKYDEDILKIMNSKPSSLDALYEIINDIDFKSFYPILFKLKENNFLYDIKQKKSQMELLLIDYLFGGYHEANILEFEKFSHYIISGKFINHYSINELRNDSDIKYSTVNGWHWMACRHFNIIDNIDIEAVNNYMYDDTIIINHCFIEPYNPDSYFKESLINQINEIIKDCSELNLTLISETAKTITDVIKTLT